MEEDRNEGGGSSVSRIFERKFENNEDQKKNF